MLGIVIAISPFHQSNAQEDSDKPQENFAVDEAELKKIKALMDSVKPNIEMSNRALELEKYTKSEEYIQRQAKYQLSLSQILELDAVSEELPQKITKTDQLILFVSSSMPIDTLRRYARQIERVDGLMVLRGTIGDGTRLQPTLDFLTSVLKKDIDCEGLGCDVIGTYLTVDPRLFRLNEIKQVPALVYSDDLNLLNYASQEENENAFPSASSFVVYGDATLLGMVREIKRKTKNDKLDFYVKKLVRK